MPFALFIYQTKYSKESLVFINGKIIQLYLIFLMNERYTLVPIRIHIHLRSDVIAQTLNLFFARAADIIEILPLTLTVRVFLSVLFE